MYGIITLAFSNISLVPVSLSYINILRIAWVTSTNLMDYLKRTKSNDSPLTFISYFIGRFKMFSL